MGGPKTGYYYISSALDPKLVVGVDGVGNPWVPVITDGKKNIFKVTKLENGEYTLVLQYLSERPQFIQDDAGKLVGNEHPPPSDWIIEGSDCGPYKIIVAGGLTRGWVLNGENPKTPVTLENFEHPLANQYWNFVPKIGLL